jgi:hypothetical protein
VRLGQQEEINHTDPPFSVDQNICLDIRRWKNFQSLMQHKTNPGRMMPKTYSGYSNTAQLQVTKGIYECPHILMMQTLWWFDPPYEEEYCWSSHGFSYSLQQKDSGTIPHLILLSVNEVNHYIIIINLVEFYFQHDFDMHMLVRIQTCWVTAFLTTWHTAIMDDGVKGCRNQVNIYSA